ncbi:MAG: multi-sensor signal transduction histidine [Desulfovibrionaceae bacterium]|nr:MAG: multi-sensor signal transduction histidine [Desulfovibrionaceae bacterium]
MQSMVNNLPNEESIFHFVCRGLMDVPGVADVRRAPADTGDASPSSVLLPIKTDKAYWGELAVTVADNSLFAPYLDYLHNFCFMLAVILEERSQRRQIESHKARLEERVQQRTRQLTEQQAVHRLTERELGKNRMMLEYILDAVPQSVFWKGRTSVYMGCNKAFARAAGVAHPDDIVGKTDYDLPWLKEESDSYRRDDQQVMRQNRPKLHIIETQMAASGVRQWVDTSKIPLADAQGEVMGVLGIYEDVTDRKHSEEALRESEARYRRLHESMMDGFARVRMDGRIVESNLSFQTMTGYTAEELDHLTYEDLTPRKWHEFEAGIIRDQLMVRGYSDVYEKEYLHKNRTIFPVELRAYLIRGEDGEPSGMWGIVRDVTERRRLMDIMIQNEKMMSVGGLAAGMAHEINNPLSGIAQGAQVVANRLNLDSKHSSEAARELGIDPDRLTAFLKRRAIPQMIDSIRESAMRAAHIVSTMLEFSRKSDTAKTLANVNDLLDKAVELGGADYDLKKKYDFRRIVIEREYHLDLPLIPCSMVQIQQVLLNLLGNAAHAMGDRSPGAPPARIILRSALEGDMVRIEVEDNGPGIDETTQHRIFEPFFTTKATGEGTGLGLSLSYFIIVNNHGGTIRVVSAPGKGTRFIIRLPLQADAPAAPPD